MCSEWSPSPHWLLWLLSKCSQTLKDDCPRQVWHKQTDGWIYKRTSAFLEPKTYALCRAVRKVTATVCTGCPNSHCSIIRAQLDIRAFKVMGGWPSRLYAWPSWLYGGGPCDFSVIPSPNWTFGFWTSFGLGLGAQLDKREMSSPNPKSSVPWPNPKPSQSQKSKSHWQCYQLGPICWSRSDYRTFVNI